MPNTFFIVILIFYNYLRRIETVADKLMDHPLIALGINQIAHAMLCARKQLKALF